MGNQSSSNVNYTSNYSTSRSYDGSLVDKCAPFTKSPLDELRRGYGNGKRMSRPRLQVGIRPRNIQPINIQQISKPENVEPKTEIVVTKTETDPINITTDNIETNKT